MHQHRCSGLWRPAFRPHSIAFLLSALLLLLVLPPAASLRFYLEDRDRRCFKFDAPYSSRVIGERVVVNGQGQATLSIEVKSPSGRVVWVSETGEPADAKFSFITPDHFTEHENEMDDDYDYDAFDVDASYSVCLMLAFDTALHNANAKRAVSFWIRADRTSVLKGQEPKAKEDSVMNVHDALKSMHETLKSIVMDLTSLQQRESRLVKRNRGTGRQLVWLAVISLAVLVATAVLQFMHFKTFFKAKKLL